MSNFIRSLFLFSFLVLFISGASAFEDNFNDGNLDGWNIISGSWDAYGSINGNGVMEHSYSGSIQYFKIKLRGSLISGGSYCSGAYDSLKFNFASNSTSSHYIEFWQGGTNYVACGQGSPTPGRFIKTDLSGYTSSFQWEGNQNYTIIGEISGNNLLISVFNNSNVLMDSDYISYVPLESTKTSLENHNANYITYFDDIIVSSINVNLPTFVDIENENYAINDIIKASYSVSNSFWSFLYSYKLNFVNAANEKILYSYSDLPQSGTYYIQPTNAGSLRVDLIKTFLGDTVLASDTALVGSYTSYIFMNNVAAVGVLQNVSYRWGFTPTQNSYKYITTKWFDPKTNAWEAEYSYIVTGTTLNTLYTTQILFAKEGLYLVELKDLNKQAVAASVQVNAYLQGGIPLHNFTRSNLTVLYPQVQYAAGDWLQYSYVVDSYNYSRYQISVELYNYAYSSYQLLTWVQGEIDTSKTYLQNKMLPGVNAVALTATNSTAHFILSYQNITISSVDSEGYGLTSDKTEACLNEKILVTVISPDNATVRVSGKTSVTFNITGTKTFEVKMLQDTSISLDVAGSQKKLLLLTKKDCGGIPGIVPAPSSGPEATTKFLSSGMLVVLIVMMIFAGAGQMIGGFSGAALGFGSGFIFLSVFGYVPVWALFLFAIIVITAFAVMGGKSLVGGGND